MTRRGPPGHLTRPSRGAFFLAASENSCHCPLPKSQLASAHRANKPTLPNLPTLLPNLPTLSRGQPLPQCLSQQSFSSSRGLSSPSRLIASTCCRLPISLALPIPSQRCRSRLCCRICRHCPAGCHCPHRGQTSAVSSACPLDEFSCMAWTAHRPARVRQKICAADFPPCWHGCRGPLVWTNSLFRQALDCKSSRLIDSTCCRFCRLPTLPISLALPIPSQRCRSRHCCRICRHCPAGCHCPSV